MAYTSFWAAGKLAGPGDKRGTGEDGQLGDLVDLGLTAALS